MANSSESAINPNANLMSMDSSSSSSSTDGAAQRIGQQQVNCQLPPLPTNHHPVNLQRQTSLPSTQHTNLKHGQPLKSCLKRKDSTTPSVGTGNPANTAGATRRMSELDESALARFQTATIQQQRRNSAASMFVPYVGYLFTCDHDSCTRYCYYNGLEKRRRVKIYKQLTRTKVNSSSGRRSSSQSRRQVKKSIL